MDKQSIIGMLNRHPKLAKMMFTVYNSLPFNNRIKGDVRYGMSFMKGCKVQCVGTGNTIILGDFSRLIGCTIRIHGNNNTIRIGDGCYGEQAVFWIEDDNNTIAVGDRTTFCGKIQLAAIEGTQITIGEDCLFSSNIEIRTGDSHSIIQKGTTNRINPSRSVTIQDHVWVGSGVKILKGTNIPGHCVVGAGSLLCKEYTTPYCALAGVPAKEVKQEIDWLAKRI